uniref:DOMON domain-containing protein n=1 Tax=Strigamia maritima TaxID=126957 RepID=T1IHN6_STRMM
MMKSMKYESSKVPYSSHYIRLTRLCMAVIIFIGISISIFILFNVPKENLAQLAEKNQDPIFHLLLDRESQFEFFWDVHYETETVLMEIHSHVKPDDWLAVGFSDYGKIENADFCVFWVDEKGKTFFFDGWTNQKAILHVDKLQNCHLTNTSYFNNMRTLLWKRKFDTCEVDDYVIQEGTTHVVYAMGEGPLTSIEGIKLTQNKHGFQRTQLLKNKIPIPPLPEDVKTITLVNDKIRVPAIETTYWWSIHKIPPLSNKHHIVQYEAVIEPGNEGLVHHIILYHCEIPVTQQLNNYSGFGSSKLKMYYETCIRMLAGWNLGSSVSPFRYPKEAGAAIGGSNFSQYVKLEIHYNNEQLKNDLIDSSGIRLYYTSQLRPYDVGVLELGLEYTAKMGIPPLENEFILQGHCIPECTEKGIPPPGIVVFASQLHTHMTGIRVTTRHIRNGIEMALLNRDDHYSPHFQEIRILKAPIHVLPGDGLITSCTYNTSGRAQITMTGYSTTDEMCMNFIHYYPKVELEKCQSSIEISALENYFNFMKEFENQPTSNKKDVIANYHSINWNSQRSHMLRDFYAAAPLAMYCNQSNGQNDLDQLSESQQPFFHVPLDHGGKLELFWDVYYDTDTVVMEIHSQMRPDDWLAVGFSDYGEIENADLCVFWVDRKGKSHFMDTWTDEKSILHVDKHQNCHLAKMTYFDDVRILVWRREFDTCENDDYIIEEGTTHILYAMGEGPLPDIEGIKLNEKEHGFQRTQLLKNINPVPLLPKDAKTLTFLNDKVHVPASKTTYWCSLHKMPLLPNKHHIVQFEAVIQPGNEALVHHIELFHCEIPATQNMDDYNAACTHEYRPPHYETCRKVLVAWAMGAGPITYPKEAGAPIGGGNFSQFVMLEVHYVNPELKNDWVDSSGIQIHYTSQLRQYDAGILELGLDDTPKMAIPPLQNEFKLSGHCIPECTEKAIPATGIVVFASHLHTHSTGIRVTTRHIRNGIEMALLNGDDHYSDHFQENRILKTPTLVLPGDGLITSCTYNSLGRPNITVCGLSKTDEMCVNFIHYYPKIDLEVCKSSIDTKVLENFFRFMNKHENQPTSIENDVITNYRSINWNPQRILMLSDLYGRALLATHCNQSNGDSFPGYWRNMPQVKVLKRLPELPRECPINN